MWRIGQLAQMTGVSQRTLRHYDRIGILRAATVDRTNGYRWYGAPELTRLERIRALQQLGLPLRLIADVIDASASDVNDAVAENVIAVREQIAALTDAATAAERHLATGGDVLPQRTWIGRHELTPRGPTLEQHLTDGDGVTATVLEIPVLAPSDP